MKQRMKRAMSLLLAMILIMGNCMAQSSAVEAAPKVKEIKLNSSSKQMFAGGYNLKG